MSVHGLQRKGFYGEYKKSYFLLSSMDGHSSLNLDKWDVPKQCQKTRGGKYISKTNFNFTPKQAELLKRRRCNFKRPPANTSGRKKASEDALTATM